MRGDTRRLWSALMLVVVVAVIATMAVPWATDLHSTNGTTLTNDVGEALICKPGVPVPMGDGWTVGLGEYQITIVRRAGLG